LIEPGLSIQATLCFILKNDKVLLLKKNPGLFGAGKWNAPGGKQQSDETVEECAVRETFEETGLRVRPKKIAILEFFKYDKRSDPEWIGHVFLTRDFRGTLREGKEGVLRWFPISSPPFEEMWEDDRYWFRHVVEERRFHGRFYFHGDFEKLIDHEIAFV